MEDIREGFPDTLESYSDDYDYSSDSDLEVDDEEVKPSKVEEPRVVAESTLLERDVSPAPGSEEPGDIIHIEKEDARSETSGVMSASDMGSALSELSDIKCVPVPVDPSLSQHSRASLVAMVRPTSTTW